MTLDEDNTPPGTSKLGGLPDLPSGATWPTRRYEYPEEDKGLWSEDDRIQPLAFLAQINLADASEAGCDLPLPSAGLLLFFYDAEGQPWGYDPADATGSQVLFVSAGMPTRRQANLQGASSRVRPLQLRPSEGLPSLLWMQSEMKDDLQYSDYELPELSDEDFQKISFDGHVLGGWPDLIQNPMELECEMVAHGIYAGNSEGYADPRVPELEKSAKDWRLLMQLNSDDDLDWMWGDAGKVYFWCRENDIAQGRFDRVWTILQCS